MSETWAALGVLLIYVLFLLRGKAEIKGPLILRKTKKGIKLIDSIARKAPRFWRLYGNIGIIVGFLGMIFITFVLVVNTWYIIVTPTAPPGIAPALPGIRIPGSPLYIPLFYGLVAIAVLMLVHEGAHGIIARTEKIRIKSVGALLLLVLPGAFVEPDDKQIKKSSRRAKLRIFAAGSFTNLIIAFICLSILAFTLPVLLETRGVGVYKVMDGYPAANVIEPGIIITKLDEREVRNPEEIVAYMRKTEPGQALVVTDIEEKTYEMTLAENPNSSVKSGYMGIIFGSYKPTPVYTFVWGAFGLIQLVQVLSPSAYIASVFEWVFIKTLLWVFVLNFAVGLVNLLPLKPFDGGLMFAEMTGSLKQKTARIVERGVYAIIIFALLVNALLPYLRGLVG